MNFTPQTSKYPQFAPAMAPLKAVPAPSAINRHWIKPEEAERIKGLGWARSFFEEAHQAWEQLNTLRTTPRPELTLTAHQQQVNKAYQTATARVAKASDRAREEVRKARTDYATALATAAGLSRPEPSDVEIRQALRELPANQRLSALLAAVDRQDRDVLRAALLAPGASVTVGVAGAELAKIRKAWERTAAPELVGNLERLAKAEQQLLQGVDSWLTEGAKLAYAQELREAEQAREQAERIESGFAAELT